MENRDGASIVRGGLPFYGIALGMMMMDCKFPRVRGDIGNAATWPFPVMYRVVRGAVAERLARAEPDEELIQPFIDAARQLESDGVRAITTSCGFLAVHQPVLADAVDIPVFASSLLQVPMAASVMSPGQRVGIITAREVLTEAHYKGVGWSSDDIPVVQIAPSDDSHFVATFVGDGLEADVNRIDQEITDVALRLRRQNPDVGAIVLECANLAPFGTSVRRVTGLPVFDLYTLGMHAYFTCVGTEFVTSPAADADRTPR
jgi:Asp/Glu/hydantoin racemase